MWYLMRNLKIRQISGFNGISGGWVKHMPQNLVGCMKQTGTL